MKKTMEQQTKGYIASNRKMKIRKLIERVIECIVVLCTTYLLILPAHTLKKEQKVLDCQFAIHQHTLACYSETNELLCKEADFVIHQHVEDCYDENHVLVCKLNEIEAHNHNDACYETKERLICENTEKDHKHSDACKRNEKILICEEKAIPHTHDESCFNDSGVVTCDKLQVNEHIHNDDCFKVVSTDEEIKEAKGEEIANEENNSEDNKTLKGEAVSENQTSNSENSRVKSSGDGWGYNADGSIYWGVNKYQIITSIETGKAYFITEKDKNSILTNGNLTLTLNGTNGTHDIQGLGVSAVSSSTNYADYDYWYFEKIEGENKYYMYYQDVDGNKQYIQFTLCDLMMWDHNTCNILLTNDQAQASKLTIDLVKNLPGATSEITINEKNQIAICYDEETTSTRYYLNSYHGENETLYWGYPELSGGSCLNISSTDLIQTQDSANLIEADTNANSVVNLFDYWVDGNQTDPDNHSASMTSGINENHAFKFTYGDQSENAGVDLNLYTGQQANPRQGIVANRLNEDGYPVLSGNFPVEGYNSTESLEYLFNPRSAHAGKASYRNVSGLLTVDPQGYFSYDSEENMAEFIKEDNDFDLYDKPCEGGQFFPFNVAPQIMDCPKTDPLVNHYFGLTITTRFVTRHSGHTDERKNTPTTFDFSGDDDVWIFIDGVLVGDVGGIHDASDVSINFATGDIEVKVHGGSTPLKTNLYECYQNAGRTTYTRWHEINDNGTTKKIFADNSVHTLKFFYLERGNYESNMTLKYNLTEIPDTSIYKVDQYGVAVKDAKFAVYAANDNFQLLNNKNGTPVTLPADIHDVKYDEEGNILGGDGGVLAHALYICTSDENGKMTFIDEDQMPYSINELEDMFGQKFILREIDVPDIYRIVNSETHLRIVHGALQRFLKCENSSVSGSRVDPTLHVTATDMLNLRRAYQGDLVPGYKGEKLIEYCKANGESNGLLFAVVFKYSGAVDENKKATEVNDPEVWLPVYGNDKEGYNVVPIGNAHNDIQLDALEAAIQAANSAVDKYGADGTIFEISPSSTMQLEMVNLPGGPSKYYAMLSDADKGNARYTVAYYWTDQKDLKNATTDNTYRVYTLAESVGAGESYSAFERVFGANIRVPNLTNNLLVEKIDENRQNLNGAVFGLYKVNQLDDAQGTLQAKAQDGSTVTIVPNSTPDPETGALMSEEKKKIMPIQLDTTRDFDDGLHKGTCDFYNIADGQYIVKEVKAPAGYEINTTDTMVLIDDEMIYCNAGTDTDGVTVGRGPGYLANPMNLYASDGAIDNTLTWVYARMLISPVSKKFSYARRTDLDWKYLTENFTGNCGTKEQAVISYLKYTPNVNANYTGEERYNYIPNEERLAVPGTQNPSDTRRLYTKVGWNHYAILQDYEYGKPIAEAKKAYYEDWSMDGDTERNLMHLFSRSNYIIVSDPGQDNEIVVNKTNAYNPDNKLKDAQFILYKLDTNNEKQYYVKNEDGTIEWNTSKDQAYKATTGDDGLTTGGFVKIDDGTYYLEEIKAPYAYHMLEKPLIITLDRTKVTLDANNKLVIIQSVKEYSMKQQIDLLILLRYQINHMIWYYLKQEVVESFYI